jgi:mono/diheme cytochrome c family protein
MATYLKDQSDHARPQQPLRAAIPPARLAAGKVVYAEHCASCHRPDGRGIEHTAPALAANTAVTAREPANVIMAVLSGFEPEGLWRGMASFAKVLSDQQVADVTNYVRTAWGNDGEPNASPWTIGNLRAMAEVPASGERAAVLCPTLPADVLKPALDVGADTLRRAAADPREMRQVINRYSAARPRSSAADLIEALSTAYCRAVATGQASEARTGAAVAVFSEQAASVLASGGGSQRAATGASAPAPRSPSATQATRG